MIDTKALLKNVTKPDDVVSDDDLIDKLLLNSDIRNFIMENDLSHETVLQGLNVLLAYSEDAIPNVDGIKESKIYPGYEMRLSLSDGRIVSEYVRLFKPGDFISKIQAIAEPEEMMKATLKDFSLIGQNRINVYNAARNFVISFGSREAKGLYLEGPFRTGKSYLAAAIGNEIADSGHSVLMVYYPELSSILKGSLSQDNGFQEIVDQLKRVDLLILDDFGGEVVNTLVRDEALGVVLQYRMVKNKPVIITSNVAIAKLADNCLRKDGSDAEKIKALRIVQRIQELTDEYVITEKYSNLINNGGFR